jgi:hypothetical protein
MLFGEMCDSKFFRNTAIMLFFNKSDLFDAKIETTPITCFPDTVIPAGDRKKALEFIESKFLEQNRGRKDRQIYTRVTCATDTSNIQAMFDAVKHNILTKSLTGNSLI